MTNLYTVVYEDGQILEFDGEVHITNSKCISDTEMVFDIPITVVGEPRFGSIYDREGAD